MLIVKNYLVLFLITICYNAPGVLRAPSPPGQANSSLLFLLKCRLTLIIFTSAKQCLNDITTDFTCLVMFSLFSYVYHLVIKLSYFKNNVHI